MGCCKHTQNAINLYHLPIGVKFSYRNEITVFKLLYAVQNHVSQCQNVVGFF